MTEILYFVASISCLIWIIRNIFYWLALWQRHQYKLHGVFHYVTGTFQGRKLLFSPLSLVKWLIIFSYPVVVFYEDYLPVYQSSIALIFILQALLVIKELAFEHRKFPIFRYRTIFVLPFIVAGTFLLLLLPIVEKFLWLLIIDRFVPFFILVTFVAFNFPAEVIRDYRFEKLSKKRKRYLSQPIIYLIGDSRKFEMAMYLKEVLQPHVKVESNIVDEVTIRDIPKHLLRTLSENDTVNIIASLADEPEEIAQITEATRPTITVLSSVPEEILTEKKEGKETKRFINALPKKGIVLFNGDSEEMNEVYRLFKGKKALYQTSDKNRIAKSKNILPLTAFALKQKKETMSFSYIYKGEKKTVTTSFQGSYKASLLVPILSIASYLKLPDEALQNAVSKLHPLAGHGNVEVLSTGAMLIDFSTEPLSSFPGVGEYLTQFHKKRILVMMPENLVSKKSQDVHYQLGRTICHSFNYVFLTREYHFQKMINGIRREKGKCQVVQGKGKQIAKYIREVTSPGDVIVFFHKKGGIYPEVAKLITEKRG